MKDDFEVVDSKRMQDRTEVMCEEIEQVEGEVVETQNSSAAYAGEQLAVAVAGQMDWIVGLAESIMKLQEMKIQSETKVKLIEEERKKIKTEAKAYVEKMKAKNDGIVKKATIIREMMNDYYKTNNDSLSGDAFSRIIIEVINKLEVTSDE